MKKLFVFLIVFILIILSSCTKNESKEAEDFLRNMSKTQVSDVYTYNNTSYEVYVSTNSSNVYYVVTTQNEYEIYIKEERSFTYLFNDDDTSVYDYYKNNYLHYTYNRVTHEYFRIENENEVSIEVGYSGDHIIEVLESLSRLLGIEDQIEEFSSLYEVIKELYLLSNRVSTSGTDDQIMITLSIDKQKLVDDAHQFKSHLSLIYDQNKFVSILASISDSPFSSVNLSIIWNKEDLKLYPTLKIYKNQNEYYMIHPDMIFG